MALVHATCQTGEVSTEQSEDVTKYRSTTPISEAFRNFISTGWAPEQKHTPVAFAHANFAKARRAALSEKFLGQPVVIPAGDTKQRSNDTDYPYRPHTAFAYLTGWGSSTVPGSILLGIPEENGHEWLLFTRPPAPRTSDEFYANSAIGEFWTGRRPGLADVAQWLGIDTRDSETWSVSSLPLISRVAIIREADPALTMHVDGARAYDGPEESSEDHRLAQVVSEMRLVKDEWEVEQLQLAVAATHRGFDDIIRALPAAIAHPRGERVIEGAFHARARLEGNDTGYGTIAASGPHACILHWVTNDGPVRESDLVLVDAGVELDTLYTADITRTLPVSGTFSPLHATVYQAVLDAADAAFAAVRPGILFRDVHQAAMKVIAASVAEWGFLPVSLEDSLSPEGQHHRRYMIHGTSHHVGLDVHDCAQARREMYMDKELEPGMVFTIEPGLYFQPDDHTVPEPWRGIGVRIEDNIVVTKDGARNLSEGIPRTIAEVENWMRTTANSIH
jgi:Xaa-Pro aminopeptidase